jgi:aminoglycoside phosphotransferase (APT) family kinase protein
MIMEWELSLSDAIKATGRDAIRSDRAGNPVAVQPRRPPDSRDVAARYRPPPQRALRWVETVLGSGARVLNRSRLLGGLTAHMDRLTVGAGDRTFDVVLRRWPEHPWATGLVDREAAGLEALAHHDLPAPSLLGADRTGDVAGGPCLLMTAVPGEPLLAPPDLADCVRQMADLLVRVHDVVPTGLAPTDPHGVDERTDHGWIRSPGRARAVAHAAAEHTPRHPGVLVHGDYQQLNVLWLGQRLSGVVDWTYAGSGPREIDVGHCRLALAVLFTTDAAETFLRRYEAEAGVSVDPRGDIRALLAFGPSWLEFVPRQVAGRARVELPGMADRVEALLRSALTRL